MVYEEKLFEVNELIIMRFSFFLEVKSYYVDCIILLLYIFFWLLNIDVV